jgi:hypothetical protein
LKKLFNRKTVSVVDFQVPNLLNEQGYPVFSDYPTLVEAQVLKLTDHLSNTQLELNGHLAGRQ